MLVNCTALFQGWIKWNKTQYTLVVARRLEGYGLFYAAQNTLFHWFLAGINASTNSNIIFHQPNIHLLLFCYSFSVSTWNLLLPYVLVPAIFFATTDTHEYTHGIHSHRHHSHSCSTKRTLSKFSMQWDTNILIQTDGILANVETLVLLSIYVINLRQQHENILEMDRITFFVSLVCSIVMFNEYESWIPNKGWTVEFNSVQMGTLIVLFFIQYLIR